MKNETENKIISEILRRSEAREEALHKIDVRRSNDAAIREVLTDASDLPSEEIDKIIREVRAECKKKESVLHLTEHRKIGMGMKSGVAAMILLFVWFLSYQIYNIEKNRLTTPTVSQKMAQDEAEKSNQLLSESKHPSLNQLNAPPQDIETSSVNQPEKKFLSDTRKIYVSVSQNAFAPVRMKLTASRKGSDSRLTEWKQKGVLKEPPYEGDYQRYGKLNLGADNKTFHYIFDITDDPHPLLYFDTNADGDLTNDGPPIRNRGTGYFSAVLKIPFKYLCPVNFSEMFEIRFFSRSNLWEKGLTQHYSRTQLQGTIDIEGNSYNAYLVDRGENNADLTNDGVYIDLNADGDIDSTNEYIPHHGPAIINNKSYVFIITW